MNYSLIKDKIKTFSLAELLIVKRESQEMCLLNLSRASELKAQSSKLMRRCAFTLAEVLITLGIIGIVAAMTIPTLIKNYEKAQTISQLKAVFTQLNNALNMAKVDNGTDINVWYIPNDTPANAATYFAQTYLIPYLKISKTCGTSTSTDCVLNEGSLKNYTQSTKSYYAISGSSGAFSFTLANGAVCQVQMLAALNGTSIQDNRVAVIFDVNGYQKPNVYGRDTFMVELGGGELIQNKNKFLPYMFGGASRDYFLGTADGNCCNITAGNGKYCFAIIMLDNWQIKDDYPWN